MQNLQQYYGVGIRVSRDVQLEKYESSRTQVRAAVADLKFDQGNEYGLYVTKVEFFACEDEHFGVGPLDKRLKQAMMRIGVNPRQREDQSIVFLNERIPPKLWLLSSATQPSVSRFLIESTLETPFHTDGSLFELLVLTGVRRDVRARDRKLKVTVIAFPTSTFAQRLKNFDGKVSTKLDYPLDPQVQLALQM